MKCQREEEQQLGTWKRTGNVGTKLYMTFLFGTFPGENFSFHDEESTYCSSSETPFSRRKRSGYLGGYQRKLHFFSDHLSPVNRGGDL